MDLQTQQLAQQQSQFDVGEGNWNKQFTEAASEWSKSFDQSQQNFQTNMDYSNYWNNRNMQFSANSNVLSMQSNIFSNPNLTPDQRTSALNNSTDLTSAYIKSLQGFSEWTPPWSPGGATPTGGTTQPQAGT